VTVVKSNLIRAVVWSVRGQVQGVGFRPFVYCMAQELNITGWVRNDSAGVSILTEGESGQIHRFRERLRTESPSAAKIESISETPVAFSGYSDFRIITSQEDCSIAGVRVPPDRVICKACLAEIANQSNRRYAHPFANCTECGPRYTIIHSLPYDRLRTAMHGFSLCAACATEYADPGDRRFHAQPVCCPQCGPQLSLRSADFHEIAASGSVVEAAVEYLRRGKIVALKGIGGYQLLVRSDAEAAVRRLRERKQRPTKPLAILVATMADAEQFAHVTTQEGDILESTVGPIVLLDRRQHPQATRPLAENIAPEVDTLGVMLPTTALHHMLVRRLGVPLIVTSGNRSNEPIAISDSDACHRLSGVADVFLTHDRPIVHRADDSVVRVIAGRPVTFRVGRGLAPAPIPGLERWLRGRVTVPVMALGSQQKSAVALWTGAQAVLGAHLGDLDDPEVEVALRADIDELPRLYGCRPEQISCDAHPEYVSTRVAGQLSQRVVRVFHHHAHAVAVMAEHDLLNHEVVALTWDGTGLGPDGTIWGGEILLATVRSFTRVATLLPFALPGGEASIREPRRVGLVLAAATVGEEAALADNALLARLKYQPREAADLLEVSRRPRFSPKCTSLGRLFDGVASLLLGVTHASYEGEAAAMLEACTDADGAEIEVPTEVVDGILTFDWRPFIRKVLTAIHAGSDPTSLASEFHDWLGSWAASVVRRWPGRPIVLGGGCFQNRRLTEAVLTALNRRGRIGLLGSVVPPNDGGLAVGQLAVACANLSEVL
jgi:hydrogenase maturation protein HypF